MNQIAAVIVTYNRLSLLRQCVCALLQQSHPCDILIVDNASSDGTEQWVSQQPQLHYRNTGTNLGGAGGFNFGMRWAVEAGYEYVWIMDDDCIPSVTALEMLVKADQLLGGSTQYGFLSSAVLWTDGTECRMNRPKLANIQPLTFQAIELDLKRIIQATFVSLLIPTRIIRLYGLPVTEFFIWGDDIEYTRRLAVINHLACYHTKQSIVVHAMKTNGGSNIATDCPERISRYYYAFRNEVYVYRREGLIGWLRILAKDGYHSLRILLLSPSDKKRRLKFLWKGFFDGLRFNPPIETME